VYTAVATLLSVYAVFMAIAFKVVVEATEIAPEYKVSPLSGIEPLVV
jgi:hypothetical protein